MKKQIILGAVVLIGVVSVFAFGANGGLFTGNLTAISSIKQLSTQQVAPSIRSINNNVVKIPTTTVQKPSAATDLLTTYQKYAPLADKDRYLEFSFQTNPSATQYDKAFVYINNKKINADGLMYFNEQYIGTSNFFQENKIIKVDKLVASNKRYMMVLYKPTFTSLGYKEGDNIQWSVEICAQDDASNCSMSEMQNFQIN